MKRKVVQWSVKKLAEALLTSFGTEFGRWIVEQPPTKKADKESA